MLVAYGQPAHAQARLAVNGLRRHCEGVPVHVVSDRAVDYAAVVLYPDNDPGARLAKLHLDTLSPHHHTLYMDADTVTYSDICTPIFAILRDGWDVVIAPSTQQGAKCLHHLDNDDEVQATYRELFNWEPLQLQGGVMGFRKSEQVTALFAQWRREWRRYRDKDQGALLRALDKTPLKIWLLSNAFNGGELVKHNFGRAARK